MVATAGGSGHQTTTNLLLLPMPDGKLAEPAERL